MASTYSTSLKLELPANGDQSGTWGTTVNNNLGTLLEQAITGIQSITLGVANYVLTNLNGVSDEARNAVLLIGGTPGAVRTILVPAGQNKTYVVVNNTTGGYNVNIQTWSGSGLTGVGAIAAIPSGASIQLYCTGTNCYAVVPYTAATTSTPVVFMGYAVGTNLTVTSTPNLPIAAGQTIYNPGILYTTSGIPSNTTIVSQTSGTTGGIGVYVISNASTVGTVNFPQPIVALPVLNQIATVDYVQSKTNSMYLKGAPSADTATAAAFEGTIANSTTLIVSNYYVAGNPIGLGQYITSGPISDGTYVSAWGTGTPGNAVFTGYISGTTLTVTSGSVVGTITSSQFLQAAGSALSVGTKITGGSGLSWTVNNSQTLGSVTSPILFGAYGPITVDISGTTNNVGWVTLQNDLQPLTTSAPRAPMISYLAPLQLSNVLFSATIANLIGTLGTQSDESVSIKGGSISNVTLSGLAAAIPSNSGGTGLTSITQNALMVGNGVGNVTAIRPGAANNTLVSTVGPTITAGAFVVGTQYTILVVGTTDFTLIGASANTVGVVFTATGVGTGTGTATTNTWASGTGLTTTSGTAPYYGARGYVSFNQATTANIAASYVQSGTTVTLTVASHTFVAGHYIGVTSTSGTAVSGLYVVTSVTPTTIVYTAGTSLTTSGNITINLCSIWSSANVSNVVYQAVGIFIVNFTLPMPSSTYMAIGSCGTPNLASSVNGDDNFVSFGGGAFAGIRTTQSIRGLSENAASAAVENSQMVNVTVFA